MEEDRGRFSSPPVRRLLFALQSQVCETDDFVCVEILVEAIHTGGSDQLFWRGRGIPTHPRSYSSSGVQDLCGLSCMVSQSRRAGSYSLFGSEEADARGTNLALDVLRFEVV